MFAQNNPDIKRTMHWYFGYGAGLDFTSGSPVIDTTGKSQGAESCFTISDTCGSLLFYATPDSNGGNLIILNKNHQVMQNGILLSCCTPTQVVCIPQPGNDSIFYVFYTHLGGTLLGMLKYVTININHNGGLGEVSLSPINLFGSLSTEKVAAVKHCNGSDYWIAGKTREWPDGNKLYVWQLSSSGLNPTPVISSPGNIFEENGDGYFTFSPDGSLAAVAYVYGTSIFKQDSSYFEIYKFDNCTGIFSNPITIQFPQPYGLSFSPDNTKLYAGISDGINTGEIDTAHGFLKQYDLTIYNQDSVLSSAVILKKGAIWSNFQLGVDGKIYVADLDTSLSDFGLHKLGVIYNPNAAGLACNYVPEQIDLGGKIHILGLPYYPINYYNSFLYQNCENNIQEIAYESMVRIYPNPASDFINIQCRSSGINKIKMYNSTGVLCFEKNIADENTILDIHSLSSGLYILQLINLNNNHINTNLKFIKL